MKLVRRAVAKLAAPYPLGVLTSGGRQRLVTATEDHGPILLSEPPFTGMTPIVDGPGGCMALVEDREGSGDLYAIMGCFPGYRFQTGGIYRIREEDGGWRSRRIADLPFAHRIDIVTRAGARWLIAATLARDKSDPGDWSQPGSLYAARVPAGPDGEWRLRPVLPAIHRNHGLLVTPFQGRRSVLVSGAEGLFAADLDQPGDAWSFACIMSREISEIAVLDLDGDGTDELATIEPFHGNRLCVYRQTSEGWRPAWEAELEFGHGLAAGRLDGVPCIVVSNRAGPRDLLLFQFPRGLSAPQRSVIEAGAGAANALILPGAAGARIVATNQAAGEIVIYEAGQGEL